jgi:large subunit ribosomal protein L19
MRNHPNFDKPRMQLLAALDLEHRQRADPEGLKSRLLDTSSPDAIRIGDQITIETIKSRSYPKSLNFTGICKKITQNGYTSAIGIETVIMGTTINMKFKVYSPLVRNISILKRKEILQAEHEAESSKENLK